LTALPSYLITLPVLLTALPSYLITLPSLLTDLITLPIQGEQHTS